MATPPGPERPAGQVGGRIQTAENRQDLAARALEAHNRYRDSAGVPSLVWDAQLAADAAAYGSQLAAAGALVHSPRDQRRGQGENLWMGTRGRFSVEAMVDDWGSERVMFRPGVFPSVSTTGNWADVAHYTQMIWRDTTRLGCALHQAEGWDYLICRYAPQGNIDGQRVP